MMSNTFNICITGPASRVDEMYDLQNALMTAYPTLIYNLVRTRFQLAGENGMEDVIVDGHQNYLYNIWVPDCFSEAATGDNTDINNICQHIRELLKAQVVVALTKNKDTDVLGESTMQAVAGAIRSYVGCPAVVVVRNPKDIGAISAAIRGAFFARIDADKDSDRLIYPDYTTDRMKKNTIGLGRQASDDLYRYFKESKVEKPEPKPVAQSIMQMVDEVYNRMKTIVEHMDEPDTSSTYRPSEARCNCEDPQDDFPWPIPDPDKYGKCGHE